MASQNQLSREEFDRLREKFSVDGEPDYLDELYTQVRGVYMMAESIRAIDVSGAEPDMAFIPPTN
jgi:Asp-tRNA(Asn)/Glu-tRNA(Gln) amidotransferase C subunit